MFKRSKPASIILIVTLFLQIALGFLSKTNFGISNGEWTNEYFFPLLSVLLLLVLIPYAMHETDKKYKHGGIAGQYEKLEDKDYGALESIVPGIIARQSIQAAISIGIVFVLINNPSQSFRWNDFLSCPQAFIYIVIAMLLSASIVTTLISILCYDYSTRFKWRKGKEDKSLFRKGHIFGNFSFYTLMISLVCLTIYVHWLVTIVLTGSIYILMWFYYYFETEHI